MLDNHLCRRDENVNKAVVIGRGSLDRHLETQALNGIIRSENFLEKAYPEALGILVFVTLARPLAAELLRIGLRASH